VASLAPLLDLLPDERVRALVGASGSITVPEPARPFLLAALVRHLQRPVLAIASRSEEAENLARDVQAFLGFGGAEVLPGWEVLPGEPVSPSVETMGRRLQVLARLKRDESFVIVATAQGVTQLVAPPRDLAVIELRAGIELDLDQTARRLVEMGYENNYMVERRGEFAIRGGILDVFSPAAERPVRAELWGDEITSLRQFALASQRSLSEIDSCEIAPCREVVGDEATRARAAELAERIDDPALAELAEGIMSAGVERFLPLLAGDLVPITSVLPNGSPTVVLDPKRVRDRADEILDQVEEWQRSADIDERHYASMDEVLADSEPVLLMSTFAQDSSEVDLHVETWTHLAGKPDAVVERLAALIRDDYRAVVAASLEDTARSLQRNFNNLGHRFTIEERAPTPEAAAGGSIVIAELQRGFVLPWARLALVAESDLTGRRSSAARRRIQARRRETAGPLDLQEGDYIVHEVHGIGHYKGLVERELLGTRREYIVIEYAKGDTLYVPSDQTDLVSKYIGGELPRIHRLGSGDWAKTKARVRRKAREIAQELVKLYAERMRAKGYTYNPDTPWQRELEDSFPYEETPDQIRAIEDVKDDMEKQVPMDRLVCGDVGYGKTEIAVRAAFKAVQDGKQIAVLVPTTLLAQQHHATFAERFSHFPVRVEMLSRFLSAAQAKAVLEDVAVGKVDVVVGTHRLLQPDVKFSDLGLVVVDEEQRFGVDQKEKLKQLRTNVDVLTLTATPIPRTLEMAMSGIRDMSVVDTPPENRHPVMTYVGAYEEEIVSSAIRRELLRDGQVFCVHHRVETIDHAARRIAQLVPEARVAVAHGQMDERRLEQTMLEFGDKKINVLVCTTIIESGLDIPTVNTLIVERADLLGLAQMYQLRGRVGRAHERAYAYLFYPPERALSEGAHERLKTIGEHTGLGSGFRIAMRDLEIRGAGNLLGEDQHGHISEVGFDLYVKLVASAVDESKGEPFREEPEVRIDLPLQAFIPRSYVADENLRLEAYRRVAGARDAEELDEARAELVDRYGSPPQAVDALFELAGLRALMVSRGITEVATVADHLRIRPVDLLESRQVRLQRLMPRAQWREHTATIVVPERDVPRTNVVRWVADLIQQLTSPA